MRIIQPIAVMIMATFFASCGSSHRDSAKDKAPKIVKNQAEIEELNKATADRPRHVLTRAPIVDGKPQFDKAEVISLNQSVDMNNPDAVEKVFNDNKSSRIEVTSFGSDDLSESSTEQFWWSRHRYPNSNRGYLLPYRQRQANLNRSMYPEFYYGGPRGHYQPYDFGGGCCCQSYAYSYYSYSSSSSWYSAGYM